MTRRLFWWHRHVVARQRSSLSAVYVILLALISTSVPARIVSGQELSQADERVLPPTIERIGERGIKQWRDTIIGPQSSTGSQSSPSDRIEPRDMMFQYLLNEVDQAWAGWEEDYEKLKTPDQIAVRQQRLREAFLKALGEFPERTPLNPHIVGTIQCDGYRVEKVIFESQPWHYVTAALFVPESERFQPPYPTVLVPCGHYLSAKAHDEYQSMGALLALNGMLGLVLDPIEQGERVQFPDTDPVRLPTAGHDLIGMGSILLGRSTATFEVWDGMRAIDYLQSRSDVDAEQIGCTGNSGGGTQTAYLMALDERITAAAPSCYINRQGSQIRGTYGDAEQQIFGQLAFGMDHPDYLMMQAPRQRVLVLAATDDFFDIHATWRSFRYAKRLYTRLGFAQRVDLLENGAKHNYNRQQREGAARWMAHSLAGRDNAISEPEIRLISETELQCAPSGQVARMEGYRSTYDLNEAYEKQLARHRKQLWALGNHSDLLQQIRTLVGIRQFSELPMPEVEETGVTATSGHRVERLIIKPEPGIYLPARWYQPDKPATDLVLYLHEEGHASKEARTAIDKLVHAGRAVLAVDLRGIGETSPGDSWEQGLPNYRVFYTAYMLGRSLVGMRAEDILVCTRYAAGRSAPNKPVRVHLVAVGNVAVPALHAAALQPERFTSVKLARTLRSWTEVIHARPPRLSELASVVHAVLTLYDLPDLEQTLGTKLTVE